MLDNLAIEVGPSRFARALGILLVGAIAIVPATAPSLAPTEAAPMMAGQTACGFSRATIRPRAEIQKRTHELTPRYLQRELRGHAATAR